MYLWLRRHIGPRRAAVLSSVIYALLMFLVFYYWAPPDQVFRYLGM